MKRMICSVFLLMSICSACFAQQKMDPRGMNYIYNPKPNSILYHDTLFRGSSQFQQLFYRQGNPALIRLYEKHQSNKIAGQVLGVAGSIATLFGISMVSSGSQNKGAGWALIGGGFAVTLTGGYLTIMGQQNLQMAVALFNQQNRGTALGIGIGDKQTGLVYRF